MKTRLTMRAALALGLPAVARNVGRGRRLRQSLRARFTREAGRGSVLTAAVLAGLYLWGL
jgi:hypothetical protein